MVEQIGPFVLEQSVARGRSAEVWRARDESSGMRVAIKLFDAGASPDIGNRERRLLEEIRHPSLVQVIDSGVVLEDGAGGRQWIAMEWLEGRTLAHLCATEGPLSSERTVRILDGVAAALDHLAGEGIVHGDLSPANVIVDVNDGATVIDLGLARAVLADETAHEGVIGTPRYLAPEIARGERPSAASDQYALGLLAYEALTGRWPFPETLEPMAALRHHLDSVPLPLSEHDPGASGQIDRAILRSLAKDPADRHASSGALIEELRDGGVLDSGSAVAVPALRRRVIVSVLAILTAVVVAGSLTPILHEVGWAGWAYPRKSPPGGRF